MFYHYANRRSMTSSEEALFGGPNAASRRSHGTHTTTHSAISKHLDVEELEMLLEAYFVQIDGTLNKLSTVRYSSLYLPFKLLFHFLVLYVCDFSFLRKFNFEWSSLFIS